MPVLGVTVGSAVAMRAGGSGHVARGVVVPAGSLDVFAAALQAHASALCEVVVLGDSTSYGNDDDESTYYPWLKRLKANAIAAGVTDGGHGVFHGNDYGFGAQATFADPDGFPLVTATTGTWGAGSATGVNGFENTNAGDTITIRGTGTAVRINQTRWASATKIGVTVDGGAETVYDGMIVQPQPTPYDVQPLLFSGLAEGTHTVVVRNAGPSDIKLPGVSAPTLVKTTEAGGPAAGTYYYVFTATSSHGESTASAVLGPITVNGAERPQIRFYGQTGWTSVKIYRATSAAGPFGLVDSQLSLTVGAVNGVGDGSSATPGAAPPGSNGLGTNSAATTCEFGIEFLRTAAGVVFHKEASTGQVTSGYFDHKVNPASTRSYAPARFGMKSEGQATSVNGYMHGLPEGPHPTYRKVRLVVIQIGTNDISSASPATDGSTQTNWDDYFENLGYGIRTARAAGADVMLISPPFTAATDPGQQHYQARFKAALLSVALSHGCAYVDFQEALGWDVYNWNSRGVGSGDIAHPHLRIAGYQAQADFLWTNIMLPLLNS